MDFGNIGSALKQVADTAIDTAGDVLMDKIQQNGPPNGPDEVGQLFGDTILSMATDSDLHQQAVNDTLRGCDLGAGFDPGDLPGTTDCGFDTTGAGSWVGDVLGGVLGGAGGADGTAQAGGLGGIIGGLGEVLDIAGGGDGGASLDGFGGVLDDVVGMFGGDSDIGSIVDDANLQMLADQTMNVIESTDFEQIASHIENEDWPALGEEIFDSLGGLDGIGDAFENIDADDIDKAATVIGQLADTFEQIRNGDGGLGQPPGDLPIQTGGPGGDGLMSIVDTITQGLDNPDTQEALGQIFDTISQVAADGDFGTPPLDDVSGTDNSAQLLQDVIGLVGDLASAAASDDPALGDLPDQIAPYVQDAGTQGQSVDLASHHASTLRM
jgi:hypothetical protein